MVVVENEVGDSFQLRQNSDKCKDGKKKCNIDGNVGDPPIKSNMIYHQKIRRKDSLSSYSSVEVHRIRNQDPNLLNRPAWTDARIALLQIKKVILFILSNLNIILKTI